MTKTKIPATVVYKKYWKQFGQYLEDTGSSLRIIKEKTAYGRLFISIFNGVEIVATTSERKKRGCVEILLENRSTPKDNKTYFDFLCEDKQVIEHEFGDDLIWMRDGDQPRSKNPRARISYRESFDPRDEADWERQNRWFKETLEKFDRVFTHRLQNAKL